MTNVCNTFVYSDHIFYILTSICMYCILPLVFMSCHPGVIITIAVYILYISVTIACTVSRHPLCLKTVKLVLGLFLTKTKQNPFLPSNFDGKIWPHSTQLCLGFFLLVTLFWDTLYLIVFLYILYICNNCLYILVFLNCHPGVLVAVAAPDSFNVPRVSPPSSTSPAIVYNNTLV